MQKKQKGSLAELAVASILIERGWNVLLPCGDYCRYDIVAEKEGRFLRIQVKYVTPKNGSLIINCRSSNNWSVRSYTADEIDFIAAYDPKARKSYFIAAADCNANTVTLRLAPSKNGQETGVRCADDYLDLKLPPGKTLTLDSRRPIR